MRDFRRLNVTAEGRTEETFVKQVLANYLGQFNISTDVRCVQTSRDKRKTHRGGLVSYQKAKNDILHWLKEDSSTDVRFTTMFDLYALPSNFPEFEKAQEIKDPYQKVTFLEKAFGEEIGDWRFLPYIQLHEFEALVLSKPEVLIKEYFEHTKAITQLVTLLAQTGNAELINGSEQTAPSKRILALIPEYNKIIGAEIAKSIGIEWLKTHCQHFSTWLDNLENI